jgi:hypothetical protein
VAPALEDAIDDGVREVIVVEHGAPSSRAFVRREDHRAPADVALVDDVEEDVRGIVAVGQVADLVDDEDVRFDVGRERLAQAPLTTCRGQVVDERRRGGEERLEAVLQRAVGDCDRQVRLAAPGFALEDDRVSLGHEVGAEQRADRREAQRRLVREVELLDGAQEREARGAHGAGEACAATMGHLLGE